MRLDQTLQGKSALITGSSRGIGRAIALQLAVMGADIAVNFVMNEQAALETTAAIKALGLKACTIQANVADSADQSRLVDSALRQLGRIDILVHSAALGAFKPVLNLKPNQWDLSMNVNARALLELTQKVIPDMRTRREGVILALSSIGAHCFIPNYGAIGISKAALESLVRYLAVELAPDGIRINALSGGLVDTDAIRHFPEYEKFRQEVIARTPAGRIAVPEDLARVAGFLVSPDAAWITGQTLVADGGLSLA